MIKVWDYKRVAITNFMLIQVPGEMNTMNIVNKIGEKIDWEQNDFQVIKYKFNHKYWTLIMFKIISALGRTGTLHTSTP